MKVITVLGSPKEKGKTAKALEMFEKSILEHGHTFERINIMNYKINGCLGCNACFSPKEKANCIQKDDSNFILDKIAAADMVIYATPLYAHSFPSQMKAFIDRHFCLVTNAGLPSQTSLFEGKRVVLLVTCSNPEDTTNLIQESFDRIFEELKCTIAGKYVVALSASPDYINNAQKICDTMSRNLMED